MRSLVLVTVLLGVSLAWPTAKQLVSILLRRYCSNLAKAALDCWKLNTNSFRIVSYSLRDGTLHNGIYIGAACEIKAGRSENGGLNVI
mgnify:CR=1 FL=1